MMEVLLDGWIVAKTEPEKQQVLQRFKHGLGLHREAYKSAQQTIAQVFT